MSTQIPEVAARVCARSCVRFCLLAYLRSAAVPPSSRRRSAMTMMSRHFPVRRRWRTIVRDPFTSRRPGRRRREARKEASRPKSPLRGSRPPMTLLASSRAKPATSTLCRSFRLVPGALYQIYASPGQITDIALEPGEQLTGSGPVSAGDTVRWVVGDTESGSGDTRRVHIMVKPTRPSIETNLVVNTDRRTYLIELRSREKPYMPSVAWYYPEDTAPAVPELFPRRQFSPSSLSGAIATPSRATIRLGGRSASMTMAARSISSSHPASFREKCLRCLSSVRTAIPRSSTTEPIVTC